MKIHGKQFELKWKSYFVQMCIKLCSSYLSFKCYLFKSFHIIKHRLIEFNYVQMVFLCCCFVFVFGAKLCHFYESIVASIANDSNQFQF